MDMMLTTKSTLPCAFQKLDQLRAAFRASDGAGRHDEAELQINVAEGAMALCRHHRFADDMCQIGADGEVPVHPDCSQRRARR